MNLRRRKGGWEELKREDIEELEEGKGIYNDVIIFELKQQ